MGLKKVANVLTKVGVGIRGRGKVFSLVTFKWLLTTLSLPRAFPKESKFTHKYLKS